MGYITRSDVIWSWGYQLAHLGLLTDAELLEFMSRQFSVPSIDLAGSELDAEAVELLPRRVAEKHAVIPVRVEGRSLVLAMANPLSRDAISDVQSATECDIAPVVAPAEQIARAIAKYYGGAGQC